MFRPSITVVVILQFLAISLSSTAYVESKLGPHVSKILHLDPLTKVNILVSFSGIKTALANVVQQNIVDRGQRATSIYNILTGHAQESQKEARTLLEASSLPTVNGNHNVKSFWITNQLLVRGADLELIQALAALPTVSKIEQDLVTYLQRPKVEGPAIPRDKDAEILAEWNVEKMGVHLVWEAPWGNNGTGVVVGLIDTGVRGTHEAIRDQYRNDGKSWRDPYNQYAVPTDIYNHGTHTAGSVLGKFGIGMAPDAQWIACKGYQDDGGAEMSAFTECGEFMVCPTDSNGQNPDCTLTPHVTSNSWGVWTGTDYFEDILDVWESVGIVSLFSMGNEGSACSNMIAPADSSKTIGVGATGENDDLAYFSSRGPSRYGQIKPDISAPGVGIRSCDCRGDDLYVTYSGTSMSCPNAAGVATLMVGKDRNLSFSRLQEILETTAVRSSVTTGETCGGVADTQWPNNQYGHGRIDAFQAVQTV